MDAAYYNLYRVIGLNVAYYRNLRGMSQEQLGAEIDVDQSHISKIERAAIGISINNLCKIAEALQVEPYQLIKPLK